MGKDNSEEKTWLMYNLRKGLLDAFAQPEEKILAKMVEAVRETANCPMCSLWGVNVNNTKTIETKKEGPFRSASLLCRSEAKSFSYPATEDVDFVHGLAGTFIGKVIEKTKETGVPYLRKQIDDCGEHLSIEKIKALGIKYLVGIPICDNKGGEAIALLELAFYEEPQFEQPYSLAMTVCEVFLSALSRRKLYKKEQLIEKLVKNYEEKGRKKIETIFYPIIDKIFKQCFDYEGASVFLWNSYDNRYNLLTTTGIVNMLGDHQDVFYKEGDGLTGKVAVEGEEKKAKIYDDLIALERRNDSRYQHIWQEVNKEKGKTMLVVPIVRPSRPDVVMGIVRFTNKINKQSKEKYGENHKDKWVVDYFNDADVEMINHASQYLALNIDYFFGEEERTDFISKMSHESRSPANAIRVSANRVIRKMEDPKFMTTEFLHYMRSISDYAELQIMQADINLYLSRFYRNTPKNEQYKNVDKTQVQKILKDSINIIRPYVRQLNTDRGAELERIMFDNIVIKDDFPNTSLYVDTGAFKIVFSNLLTNAVKYRKKGSEFRVEISGEEKYEGLTIRISDWGMGVTKGDEEKIFLLGVRSDAVKEFNIEGYGIGAYVTRQILGDFGGSIRVSHNSNPTTFEIKLPRELYNNDYLTSKKWTE
jgi:signal transduction histidine kinase